MAILTVAYLLWLYLPWLYLIWKADWLARQLELMTRRLDAVQREKGALEKVEP